MDSNKEIQENQHREMQLAPLANVGGFSSLLLTQISHGVQSRDLMREKMKAPLPPHHRKWTLPPKSRVSLTLDLAIEYELQHGRQLDPNMDTKTIRRTISNRLSAQRSRMKKYQYIVDLEKMARDLEIKLAGLNPKLEIAIERKRLVKEENDSLRAMIKIREVEAIQSQRKLEENRLEIIRLKEIHNIRNFQSSNAYPNPKPYSLEFYQQRLMRMELNQLMNQNMIIPSSSVVDDEDEEAVDQYLNLDGAAFN